MMSYGELRDVLHEIAAAREIHSGIPMPVNGQRLVIEKNFPDSKLLSEIGQNEEPDVPDELVRNVFYSHHTRCDVAVLLNRDTQKVCHAKIPKFHGLNFQLQTLGASVAWGFEQECVATDLLMNLIPDHKFQQYLLTGMFLERSERSGVMYLFRRLRPTVAIRMEDDDTCRVLCALCLHPIGYYAGSWAGAMCPTDEVVAHLMLMRGDEHMYWRRANQHRAYRPEAGL